MKAHELKGCLLVIIGITLVSEILGLTGLTTSPHSELHRILFSNSSVFLVGGITVHSFLMKVFSPAGKNELILILLACIFFSFFYFVSNDVSRLPYWYLSGVPQAGLGVASFCIIFYKSIFAAGDDRNINRDLLIGSACIFLVALNIECYLQLTSAIHPLVYDLSAYKFDLSLGADFSSYIAVLLNTHSLLKSVSVLAYFLVPYGFSVLFGLYVASPDKVPVNILFVIFTSMFCAYLFYHLTPAAGPQYAFGKLFPLAMPSAGEINSAFSVIAPAPRNAIPSMHFGWTFIMWVISLRYNFVVRTAFGLLMIFNIFATLGLGEHYLIDLIIAIPFMLFVFAFCRKLLKEQDALRNQAFLFGIIITVLWCIYIHAGYEYFDLIPGLSWLLVFATILSSYRYYSVLTYSGFDKHKDRCPDITDKVATQGFNAATLVVCFVFFFSGFAALVYQVLFSKVLSYTFGSNSSAVYTVLATYMGGMAIGAWLGGKIVLLGKPPLRVYAIIETVIALYCLLSLPVFRLVQYFYSFIGAGMLPGQASLDVIRFLLGVLVLLVPTVLMGMTLPVLISHFRARKQAYGSSIAKLYSANTIGAASGALVSGYFIIPVIGINNTIHLAVWINLLAAGIAYIYSNKQGFIQFTGGADDIEATSCVQTGKNSFIWTGSGYVAVFVVGIISLGLEVIYIHMLSIVAGNSVYAFSLMLFTFLLGLGAGSEMARQIMKQNIKISYLISLLTVILTITVFTGVFIWDVIPGYFASFAYYPLARTFVEREFIRGLVCFVCMFPPAVIIGCLYPSCLQHVADLAKEARIRAVSGAIAINTVGNILGVLLVGFILLPGPGALNSLHILAFLALLMCIYFSWFSLPRQRIVTGLLTVVAVFIFVSLPGSFDYNNLATGANVYFRAQNFGEVIDHQESLDGGLTTVHNYKIPESKTIKTLVTNGKFQGTDDKSGEMIPQLGYAVVPLMHTSARGRALVIGYGTGATASVLHDAGFEELDVVDISKDIFTLADKYFTNINNAVTKNPDVNKYITDGRNFLLLSENKYDLISIQISSIWFAGAASLYNREFYKLINKNMNQGGVLQQWVQLHHITPYDLLYIIGTMRSEFKYVWLYVVGEQGILVATNDQEKIPSELQAKDLDRIFNADDLMNIEAGSIRNLTDKILLDPDSVDRMVMSFVERHNDFPVSDDDNNILEYSTPKGNVLDSGKSYDRNLYWLKNYTTGNE